MPIAVPGQGGNAVTLLHPKREQGIREPADALTRLGIAIAVQAALQGLGNDFNVGEHLGGVVDHARNQERPIHHQSAQHERSSWYALLRQSNLGATPAPSRVRCSRARTEECAPWRSLRPKKTARSRSFA